MKGFLDYRDGDSFFHRLNPLAKNLISVFLCAVCFISGNHFFILGVIALNIVIAAGAGIIGLALGMLKGLLKLSVILFIVQVLFIGGGNLLFTIPLINVNITDEGVSFSLLLVLRLMAAALPLGIMLSLTKASDLTNALVGKLGVPYKYAFSLSTAIRFIPVFSSEMASIMESQTARGVQFDTRNPFKKLALLIPICVPLLVSSVRKIDASALSAELRGFNLRTKKSGYKKYHFKKGDFIAILCSAVILVLGILL